MSLDIKSNSQFSFNFNGKQYNSLEEMPEEIKKYFLDQNNNGLPDFVDEKMPQVAKIIEDAKKNNPALQNFKIGQNISENIDNKKEEAVFNSPNLIETTSTTSNNSALFIVLIILIFILIIYLAFK